MILMTVIAVWFVLSVIVVLALARAASRPLPQPASEFEIQVEQGDAITLPDLEPIPSAPA